MLALLKLIHSIAKTLHSEGTPAQIAGGVALGAALGLTPLMNLHNAVVVILLCIINVSFGAGLLGMALFAPLGFLFDPVFDRVGRTLLMDMPSLRPMFVWIDEQPVLAFANLTNTVVLASVVAWLVAFLPIFLLTRLLVLRYRASIGAWFVKSPVYRALSATKAVDVYNWFRA